MAAGDDQLEGEWLERNRAMWDERVPLHVASEFYGVDRFLGGEDPLRAFEPAELGDVAGLDLVHLQCHFGLDTLGWARRGARVVGLDFSEPAVEAARHLAARAGIEAEFACADVHDAVEALGRRRFDVVYTGIGALIWLPDVRRWADVVGGLLRPGGRLYLVEFHPLVWIFDEPDVIANDYFDGSPYVSDESGSYVDPAAATAHNLSYEWNHGLGQVVTALVEAGLRIDRLTERDTAFCELWPGMVRHGPQDWRLAPGRARFPLSYSLVATNVVATDPRL